MIIESCRLFASLSLFSCIIINVTVRVTVAFLWHIRNVLVAFRDANLVTKYTGNASETLRLCYGVNDFVYYDCPPSLTNNHGRKNVFTVLPVTHDLICFDTE